MNTKWPTQDKDMEAAKSIMENFAGKTQDSLGLLELYVDTKAKRMNFKLSNWVEVLAKHFSTLYGASHGDFVTRQVLTRCITNGQVVH